MGISRDSYRTAKEKLGAKILDYHIINTFESVFI